MPPVADSSSLITLAVRALARRMKLPPPNTDYRVERDLPARMRDGAVLLADRYIPAEPRGTVLMRGPYGRSGLPVEIIAGLYASYGYHVVMQSTRGTFGSGGTFEPARNEAADGAETVAWLRSQPWFDGRFATVGASYLGFTQWALLLDPPPELVTAAIVMGPHDFGQITWGTGAFTLRDSLGWNFQMAHQETGGPLRRLARSVATPWRLRHDIRQLSLGDTGGALAGGAPWHRSWIEHTDPAADYWRPAQATDALARANLPILLVAGWQDVFLDQTLQQYTTLRDRGTDVHLVVGPWTHADGGADATKLCLAWLGHAFSGNGSPPPVRIHVGGAGWRDLERWPPPTGDRILHLQPGGALADTPPAAAAPATFVYNPVDPTPTLGGRLLSGANGYRDDSALATRRDVVTFTSAPLPADLEVIGSPRVELTHHADTASADVWVRLSDVDPRGRSRNVSDGYRRLTTGSSDLEIDLDPIAHRFPAGHRIRLVIAGGSYPRFSRNLGSANGLIRSVHTVTLGSPGSRLILPVTAG